MRTVGQTLKKTREEKNISLEQVAEAIKIRKEFLEALEEDNFSSLPSYTSILGFLKNYAQFLGLSSSLMVALLKRDFPPKEPLTFPKKINKKFVWSPKIVSGLVILIFFLALSAYLGYQYFSFKKPPSLQITYPPSSQKVFEEKIEVTGKTQPDTLVFINDIPVFVPSGGEFHYEVKLFPGENKITIIAKNKSGKETKQELVVFRLDKQQ